MNKEIKIRVTEADFRRMMEREGIELPQHFNMEEVSGGQDIIFPIEIRWSEMAEKKVYPPLNNGTILSPEQISALEYLSKGNRIEGIKSIRLWGKTFDTLYSLAEAKDYMDKNFPRG